MIKFGLIGHPLTGSGSPALFHQAYGGKWDYDLIDEPSFDLAWKRFLEAYQAVNVTAPYKLDAYRMVAAEGRLSEDAVAAGAVNIVVKDDARSAAAGGNGSAGLVGYNSDYLGVRALLEAEGLGRGDVAVVAGFGGAGRAASAAARALGMDVTVCNRTPVPSGGGPSSRPLSELPLLAGIADILIYTLPVEVEEVAQLRSAAREGAGVPVVLEANYRTPCLDGLGARYLSGREWLLWQARTGYDLMTGEKYLSL